MDISEYLDVENSKKLNANLLWEWCKGKDVSALVNCIGRNDSLHLRLQLLRTILKNRSHTKKLAPFVLATPKLPLQLKDLSLPEKAFPVVIQIDDKELRSKAFSLFGIAQFSKQFILSKVQLLIQEFKYIPAFNVLVSFDYLCHPGVDSTYRVAIPLIFKNGLDIVAHEAKENPKFKQMLLNDLDSLYNHATISYFPHLAEYASPKKMNKVIRSFLNAFDCKEEDYGSIVPNFFHKRLISALIYHVSIKDELKLKEWRDIMSWNLDKYPELEREAETIINNKLFSDGKEVEYWNKKRGWNLKYLHNGRFKSKETPPGKKYFELDLPPKNIILITAQNFDHFLLKLNTSDYLTTGYDSEFLNDFGSYQSKVVLIQIAIEEEVFILDMIDIIKYDHLLESLRDNYFNNSRIKILGYGIHSDFQALATTHPIFSEYTSSSKAKASVIDLDKIAKHVENKLYVKYKSCKSEEKGLAGFIESLFGLPLDKSFQRSFWNRRPLEEKQLIYGALDARILLLAYEKLRSLSSHKKNHPEYNVFFGNKVNESTNQPKQKSKKRHKKKDKEVRCTNESLAKSEIDDSAFPKFVCNNMLHGLVKKLRAYGVDTHYLETSDPELLADAAMNAKRIILTRGKMFQRLQLTRPDVSVYNVQSNKADEQANEIISKYDIKVKEDDIFSRCVLCNCADFIMMSQEHVKFFQSVLTSSKKGSVKFNGHNVSYPSMQMSSGVILKINEVPNTVSEVVDQFYVCPHCGHVYWKGSHWEKMRLKRNSLLKN